MTPITLTNAVSGQAILINPETIARVVPFNNGASVTYTDGHHEPVVQQPAEIERLIAVARSS